MNDTESKFSVVKILAAFLYLLELAMELPSLLFYAGKFIDTDKLSIFIYAGLAVYVLFRLFVFYLIAFKVRKKLIIGIMLLAFILWSSTGLLFDNPVKDNHFNYMFRQDDNELKQQFNADSFFDSYFSDKDVYSSQSMTENYIFNDGNMYFLYDSYSFNMISEFDYDLKLVDEMAVLLAVSDDYYPIEYRKRKTSDTPVNIYAYVGEALKESKDIFICYDSLNNLYFIPKEEWEKLNEH